MTASTAANYVLLFIQYLIFFFAPIAPVLIGVGIFVLFDWISGVKAAQKRGEKITSSGFERTVIKGTLWFIAIISARIFELYFIPSIPVASLVAGFVGVVEFKSIMENIGSYTGTNVWKYLTDQIQTLRKK